MNMPKVWKLSLLPMMLFSTAYAQFTSSAVRPANTVPDGYARPHVWMGTSPGLVHGPGQTNGTCTSQGCVYFPIDLRTAYATSSIVNGKGGQGMTVGIVDAFYNSQTAADLTAFLASFPRTVSCTTTPTLTIVNQTGGTPSASLDSGWALETDLDVQWVTAIAPCANILLVTATDDSYTNLLIAEAYAIAHSNVVSNSWGSGEFGSQTSLDSSFSGSTVPVLFSSGDQGAVVSYPCSSPFVTCVGGTRLLETATSFRNVESAWTGSGGGCSTIESEPAYQSGFSDGPCTTKRGVPDIAALADPGTGAIVYLGSNVCGGFGNEANEPSCPANNFYEIGGTSLACPVTAALIANVDAARVAASKLPLGSNLNQLLYAGAAPGIYHYRYWDIITGTSGFPAIAGWDRATGLGVPLGPSLATYLLSTP